MASESEKRETLADIVAEMRRNGDAWCEDKSTNKTECLGLITLKYADRIEAAAKRERAPVGNAAAMRDALHALKDRFRDIDLAHDSLEKEIYELSAAALSAPARQCDVGTADEQDARFSRFCVEKRSGSCSGCPDAVGGFAVANGIRECALVWAQTPYDAEKGGKA